MDTAKLKKFAQYARRSLLEQVAAKVSFVLAEQSAARRENPDAIKDLEKQIAASSQQAVIDKVAYTWFNRICALRFMDVNNYNKLRVISPSTGQSQPEILAEAKQGYLDEKVVDVKTQQKINALLSGQSPSSDPQTEAYRLLLVAVCNHYHNMMPFLFEKIADYTELLLPDDLLSGNSILAYAREALTPNSCEDVEVIGWLYQFYISEKKDEVFTALKKNKKITPENIPAATQLFTPHWIVRYLVENSLGRLWMLNHPESKLIEQMDYFVASEQEQTDSDYLKITTPEELKICDPACGSGHMLTYAFDLLYSIYEEQGYAANEIPTLILTHNLFGIEIDQRAGELAAFALTMKARSKYRRFFRKVSETENQPNICVLQNIQIDKQSLDEYMDFVGRDLFTTGLRASLTDFEEADNFGSLIRPSIKDVASVLALLEAKDVSGQIFLTATHKKVLQVLKQADYLSQKYQVVIANPPYMGGKGMNLRIGKWLKDNYPEVKSDLFSAFIVRNTELAVPKGQLGFMTPFVWMFISSYEKLRSFLINEKTITSLIQLEYSGFDGATVPICTFTIENAHNPEYKGGYVRLSDFRGASNQAPKTLEAIKNPDCGWFYRASAADFRKIPGSPIAYWVSKSVINIFNKSRPLSYFSDIGKGLDTGDNNRFLRLWFETSFSSKKWVPCQKGGVYRKWYGNNFYLINWEDNGKELKKFPKSNMRNSHNYFRSGLSWTRVSSGSTAFRFFPEGSIFESTGPCVFSELIKISNLAGFLNSKLTLNFLKFMAPTLDFQSGHISALPILDLNWSKLTISSNSLVCVDTTKKDWDSYEISWDFAKISLLEFHHTPISNAYKKLQNLWNKIIINIQKLEEENNQIFIEAYDLQNELSPEVPLNEITLTCNPHYRYGGNKTEEELEALLLADTMREFISYGVGCMFGRYSLDKEGLILANQGETLEDYFQKINTMEHTENTENNQQKPSVYSVANLNSFPPDEDNVIPILEGDWFTDDITERFRKFLRVTFGDKHYEENLQFIEDALGKDIRQFFIKEFYTDHLKRYKKRPIYWLFSSPKGSFNALIYMHRYQPDTVSVILNDYLREFRTKLEANKSNLEQISISASATAGEKTKAIKDIEKLRKIIEELNDYEHDILYPLATQKVEIDLDDGVKVNYNKFSKALKKVAGLSAK